MRKENNLFGKLKDGFSRLKKDLKPMTFWEKLDHLWTYYKEYLLVLCVAGIFLGVVVNAVINWDTQYYGCGVMNNVELSREGHDYLTDVFFEQVLHSPQRGKIHLTTSNLPEQELTVTDTSTSYQVYMHVLAQIEGKQLDYMLMDEYTFGFYTEERIYTDLRELLDEEELNRLRDNNMLVYVREKNETEGIPMGIDISAMPFGQDCLLTEGKAYLVFIRNAQHPENCVKLWEHIKAWN